MKIKRLHEEAILQRYATDGASAFDVFAYERVIWGLHPQGYYVATVPISECKRWINKIFDDFEAQMKAKDEEIERLKAIVEEAIRKPMGVEPHSWSDYKMKDKE